MRVAAFFISWNRSGNEKSQSRRIGFLVLRIRGRPCGIRTCDQRIKSPRRYRLETLWSSVRAVYSHCEFHLRCSRARSAHSLPLEIHNRLTHFSATGTHTHLNQHIQKIAIVVRLFFWTGRDFWALCPQGEADRLRHVRSEGEVRDRYVSIRTPIERIQHLLGHERVTTTEIYIKARLPDVSMPNMREMAAKESVPVPAQSAQGK